jgi:hypothetical protein
MGSTWLFKHKDAIPHLHLIINIVYYKIILLSSTIDIAKTAQQIALKNNLPISSIYRPY